MPTKPDNYHRSYDGPLSQILRIIALVQSGGGWTPAMLAKDLGVTERTVYRHLNRIRSAGIAISFDEKSGRYVMRAETHDKYARPSRPKRKQ